MQILRILWYERYWDQEPSTTLSSILSPFSLYFNHPPPPFSPSIHFLGICKVFSTLLFCHSLLFCIFLTVTHCSFSLFQCSVSRLDPNSQMSPNWGKELNNFTFEEPERPLCKGFKKTYVTGFDQKVSNCTFFNFVKKTLGPGPDWIWIQEMLGSGFSKIGTWIRIRNRAFPLHSLFLWLFPLSFCSLPSLVFS